MYENFLKGISFDEARQLYFSDKEKLFGLADSLRRKFFGSKIETCSIVNARSGKCSENCKWCAQSAHHSTGVKEYPYMDDSEILRLAKSAADAGIDRFSLVTSGRSLSNDTLNKAVESFEKLRNSTSLNLCGSFGLLNKDQLLRLKNAGMTRYHCNLETAPSRFHKLCTTHTAEEKIATLNFAKSIGLEICSGGIIGMGETAEERIEMAFALRDIDVDSIPINVLQPIKGTPMETEKPLSVDDIFRTFAIFRIINPKAHIRFAGGRSIFAGEIVKALKTGVSAALVGDLLTTIGSNVKSDFELFRSLGYDC